MLFFHFGFVLEPERKVLINSFIIETGAAIIALFYSLFNLDKVKHAITKRTQNAETNISYDSWYDREYILVWNRWYYEFNNDTNLLNGTCEAIRHIKCLNAEIPYIQISYTKDVSYIPFEKTADYHVELIDDSNRTSGRGTIKIAQPHRCEGASFAFRIYFNPPLIEGEIAYLHFKYQIPNFKFAYLNDLRKSMCDTKIGTRDYEMNVFSILFPTKKFIYEVKFSRECNVSHMNLLVKRGRISFKEEKDYIQKNNLFKVKVEKDNSCHMILERENPPIKTKYLLRWKPKEKNV